MPVARRVDGRRAVQDVVVDPVLRVRRALVRVEELRGVRLVVAEQQRGSGAVGTRADDELEVPEQRVVDVDRARAGPQLRHGLVVAPGPGVAEPDRRQDVQRLGVGPGVGHLHRHEDVVRAVLGVLDLHHPEPVLVEHAGVEQLVLGLVLVAPAVLCHQVVVRERASAGSGSASG